MYIYKCTFITKLALNGHLHMLSNADTMKMISAWADIVSFTI